jgi:signal transduction histidine kinase
MNMKEDKADQLISELKSMLNNPNPDYRAIRKLSTDLSKLDTRFQNFEIDAKTLIHLGRDSIKDHTTALLELVKNSYDADAFDVDVEILCKNDNDLIRVSDNGFGMTKEQLINYWLRIGFSNKRKSKTSELGRRKTGEKGIGRISTDRLGSNLELITKTEQDGIVGLKINWNEFDVEGKDVSDIQVELINPASINIPVREEKESLTGTEIRISGLRQPWNSNNIENLYNELSSLISPFKEVTDFTVRLFNDVAPDFSKVINSEFFKAAEIEVTTIFDGTDEVFYSIKNKYSKTEIVDTISRSQFFIKSNYSVDDPPELKCGPVEVRLLFFLREGSSVVGTDFKLTDLIAFLNNNNGVKIYRDNIAVKPYGFPKAQLGYDWLGLGDRKAKNPAGVGRSEQYTVSPYQLVGAVFITRDSNLELSDSAAREGLVESEAFFDMKDFVMASIRLLESHRANIYPEIEKIKKQKNIVPAHKEVIIIKDQLSSVKEDLSLIRDEIEVRGESVQAKNFLAPLAKTISKVDKISDEVDSTITDLLAWQRVLSGLATMGISSAVFGHETEGSITLFQGAASTALKHLKTVPPNFEKAISNLEKAIANSKKVAAWGAYALTRIQKEKRTKRPIPIFKTIESVVKELRPAFEASAIEIKITGHNFLCKTYQMDIESILVNLLTNAYTASLLTKKGRKRQVVIDVNPEDKADRKGYYFSVADTGPGIAKEFKKKIFEPLFSTKSVGSNESKSVGTGLGLTIVKSIVEELEGEISVDSDKFLEGAIFKIWLPKY